MGQPWRRATKKPTAKKAKAKPVPPKALPKKRSRVWRVGQGDGRPGGGGGAILASVGRPEANIKGRALLNDRPLIVQTIAQPSPPCSRRCERSTRGCGSSTSSKNTSRRRARRWANPTVPPGIVTLREGERLSSMSVDSHLSAITRTRSSISAPAAPQRHPRASNAPTLQKKP